MGEPNNKHQHQPEFSLILVCKVEKFSFQSPKSSTDEETERERDAQNM